MHVEKHKAASWERHNDDEYRNPIIGRGQRPIVRFQHRNHTVVLISPPLALFREGFEECFRLFHCAGAIAQRRGQDHGGQKPQHHGQGCRLDGQSCSSPPSGGTKLNHVSQVGCIEAIRATTYSSCVADETVETFRVESHKDEQRREVTIQRIEPPQSIAAELSKRRRNSPYRARAETSPPSAASSLKLLVRNSAAHCAALRTPKHLSLDTKFGNRSSL